jgi:hypothetical protein
LGSLSDAPLNIPQAKPIRIPVSTKLDWVAEKSGNVVAKELFKLVMGDNDKREPDEHQASETPKMNRDPKVGLPKEYTVSRSHYFQLLGPQLALSSELDEHSTILFTMDAAAFKGYTVGDDEFLGDPVNSQVMHR